MSSAMTSDTDYGITCSLGNALRPLAGSFRSWQAKHHKSLTTNLFKLCHVGYWEIARLASPTVFVRQLPLHDMNVNSPKAHHKQSTLTALLQQLASTCPLSIEAPALYP